MIKLKESLKLIGIIILTFCVVFVCTIFLNYSFDLQLTAKQISDPHVLAVADASLTMNKVILVCSGGILGVITLLVLLFSISRYINENQQNMGILKALGYTDFKIALNFAKFGLSVLIGALLAYGAGFFASPVFYQVLDSADALPPINHNFHIETFSVAVIAPALFFTVVSVLFALLKLRKAPLQMINGSKAAKVNRLAARLQKSSGKKPFLKEVSRIILSNNLLLVFFTGFAAFAFSAQLQLAFFMDEAVFTVLFVTLALILGILTLLISLSFVVNSNKKYLAFMKSYGYTDAECNRAMFGGYRPVSYIGFLTGTIYQFFLTKLIVSIFAASGETVAVSFDIKAFFITLAAFLALYEIIMLYYKKRINLIPLREIMQS